MGNQKYTGTMETEPQAYELEHRSLSRRAAAEGMVLLKNEDNILPLEAGSKVALFGAGAVKTIKGGTGSGDVNERDSVSIYDGMAQAGYEITNKGWLEAYADYYDRARIAWREEVYRKNPDKDPFKFFDAYASTPFYLPTGPQAEDSEADTAVYIISRIAGEGKDRHNKAGDYFLTDEEHKMLQDICGYYKNVIVAVNAGGVVDLSFMEEFPNIKALLTIVQPGMEGGNAFADIISGKVTPGGKLTDTWAFRYEDYPNADTFSHNNGNVQEEYYTEGIYVGYRYFDAFGVPARYGFGYGLSYTDFTVETIGTALEKTDGAAVSVTVKVTNAGKAYAGKEVVQAYVSMPEGKLEKEYRRLCAFAKTKELAPGESQTLTLEIPIDRMASYDPQNGWVLEAGYYGVWVGASLHECRLEALLLLDEGKTLVKTEALCPLQENLEELSLEPEKRKARYDAWVADGRAQGLEPLVLDLSNVKTQVIDYTRLPKQPSAEAAALTDSLDLEQLIKLAAGNTENAFGSNLGAAGITVPGSAGETSACAAENGLPAIALADGPAGLRLNQYYFVQDGKVMPIPFEASLEHGFLCPDFAVEGDKYYQYCTAFPVGTLLAQTWDMALAQEIGQAVGDEMQRFHVTLWLAPGMNIHRNPLCGRNFEYFSEDPLVSGKMAAAITNGVQSVAGCGTTIKHFACNNQEDNRLHSNSIVSERAMREIYFKGFEIAVKESHPWSIMTSYNLINGVHSANNYDLCMKAARMEWGFDGVIMTDWTTTMQNESCTASGCMRAGNDLIMPGVPDDLADIRRALKEGTLQEKELKDCITRLADVILRAGKR